MRNLRSLSISRMPQATLSADDFLEFGMDIKELRIIHGNLDSIKAHAFMHVRGIEHLDFSENSISTIDDEAFSEVRTRRFPRFPRRNSAGIYSDRIPIVRRSTDKRRVYRGILQICHIEMFETPRHIGGTFSADAEGISRPCLLDFRDTEPIVQIVKQPAASGL